MFESMGAQEWIALILLVGALLGYAFKVERNTSSTAKSNELILGSLNSHKAENEDDHKTLHTRVDGVNGKVEVVKNDVHKLDKRVTVLENVPQNPLGDCI